MNNEFEPLDQEWLRARLTAREWDRAFCWGLVVGAGLVYFIFATGL